MSADVFKQWLEEEKTKNKAKTIRMTVVDYVIILIVVIMVSAIFYKWFV